MCVCFLLFGSGKGKEDAEADLLLEQMATESSQAEASSQVTDAKVKASQPRSVFSDLLEDKDDV